MPAPLSSLTFRAVIGHQLLVVADAHLNASAPADEEAFLAFLDRAPQLGDSLLLAGDIFDFWFTYKRLVPRACMRVTARIIELARRFPILMIGGNHDRWGDTFWSASAGITFDPRRVRCTVGDRLVVGLHGDGLHEEHWSAAALNRILGTPIVIRGFELLPPAAGFGIARLLGHYPDKTRARAERIAAAATRQAQFAGDLLRADADIGALVMGHTHRSALTEVEPGRWYVNPGAWLAEHRYAVITDSDIRLETFA
ncbi:MAG: UDP-2,3-diacylglucosamine diphosphatase [Gemmatimonadales bacterium]